MSGFNQPYIFNLVWFNSAVMRNFPLEWKQPSISPFSSLFTWPLNSSFGISKLNLEETVRLDCMMTKIKYIFLDRILGFPSLVFRAIESGDYLKSFIQRVLWKRTLRGLAKIYFLWRCWLDGIREWGQSRYGSFAERKRSFVPTEHHSVSVCGSDYRRMTVKWKQNSFYFVCVLLVTCLFGLCCVFNRNMPQSIGVKYHLRSSCITILCLFFCSDTCFRLVECQSSNGAAIPTWIKALWVCMHSFLSK